MRGIYYHHALSEYIEQQDKNWYEAHIIYLSGISLDISVVSWAKLFGNERSQKTHYVHLLKLNDLNDFLNKVNMSTEETLESNLLKSINRNKTEFDLYKTESILKYRDKFVAHMDLDLHKKH